MFFGVVGRGKKFTTFLLSSHLLSPLVSRVDEIFAWVYLPHRIGVRDNWKRCKEFSEKQSTCCWLPSWFDPSPGATADTPLRLRILKRSHIPPSPASFSRQFSGGSSGGWYTWLFALLRSAPTDALLRKLSHTVIHRQGKRELFHLHTLIGSERESELTRERGAGYVAVDACRMTSLNGAWKLE